MLCKLLRTFTITICLLLGVALTGDAGGPRVNAARPACAPVTLAVLAATLPAATLNQPYSATIESAGGSPPYTYALLSGSLPNGVSFDKGVFSGTPTQRGSFTVRIQATDAYTCTGTEDFTLTVNCPPIDLASATLPGGTAGANYSASVVATPSAAYVYSFTGTLPTGVTLNPTTGALTGSLNAVGTFNFTITATRYGMCAASKAYTVVVAACSAVIEVLPKPSGPSPTLAFALPAARRGQSYTTTISANPAGQNYSFSILAPGFLPGGLTLNPNTGVISGAPTVTGNFSFRIQAALAGGCVGSRAYSLRVN